MIFVFDAHDIILSEIAAGLDLNKHQIDLAGIFEAVPGGARRLNA